MSAAWLARQPVATLLRCKLSREYWNCRIYPLDIHARMMKTHHAFDFLHAPKWEINHHQYLALLDCCLKSLKPGIRHTYTDQRSQPGAKPGSRQGERDDCTAGNCEPCGRKGNGCKPGECTCNRACCARAFKSWQQIAALRDLRLGQRPKWDVAVCKDVNVSSLDTPEQQLLDDRFRRLHIGNYEIQTFHHDLRSSFIARYQTPCEEFF